MIDGDLEALDRYCIDTEVTREGELCIIPHFCHVHVSMGDSRLSFNIGLLILFIVILYSLEIQILA